MDDEPAAEVLEDRAVARGVRNGEVQACRHAVRQVRRVDAERLLPQFGDGLGDRGEIVQHVLRPDAQPHDGPGIAGPFIDRFGQEEQAGSQPRLVHAVGDADVVAGRGERAVLRGPANGVVGQRTAADRAAREKIEVGERVFAPVHRAPRGDHAAGTDIDGTRAGIGAGPERKGECGGAERRKETCFHGQKCFSVRTLQIRCKSERNGPAATNGSPPADRKCGERTAVNLAVRADCTTFAQTPPRRPGAKRPARAEKTPAR